MKQSCQFQTLPQGFRAYRGLLKSERVQCFCGHMQFPDEAVTGVERRSDSQRSRGRHTPHSFDTEQNICTMGHGTRRTLDALHPNCLLHWLSTRLDDM
jgi:hypothetical protein